MVPRSLQEDLLRIPGVEGAEVEGTGDQPAGLRIRIAAGADQRAVGAAIRRVLTEHGLGTDTRLPGEDVASSQDEGVEQVTPEGEGEIEAPAEPATEAEVASSVAVLEDAGADVIDLTDDEPIEEPADVVEPIEEPPADRAPAGGLDTVGELEDVELEDVEPDDALDQGEVIDPAVEAPASVDDDLLPEPPAPLLPERPAPPAPPLREPAGAAADTSESGFARIESVSVEEGRDGILVTVTSSDGETVAQLASSSEGGLDAAIVKATSRLALPEAPDPAIVEVEERRIEGVDIVMLVLDTDGRITAGSAIVVAGRAFAIGRATWSALTN